MTESRVYKPDGETLRQYLLGTQRYTFDCIQGPVMSGKSVASCMRLFKGMMEMEPEPDGVRRSRWLVTRNSYPDLEESTIKTWLQWFPEKVYGRFFWTAPYVHEIRLPGIEADVTFEAFDGDADIQSLKSREYTGVWVNEGQFYPQKLVTTLYERSGRYPRPRQPFLQMDMNAPPLGHWVPMMRGDAPIPDEMAEDERLALVKPADWTFRVQPPWFVEEKGQDGRVVDYRINPAAENLAIAGEERVKQLLSGRTRQQIDADLMNRVLIVTPGQPVFPSFSRTDHVAPAPVRPREGVVIHVGLDFGRHPAAVMAQNINGCWYVLDELTASNEAAVTFAPILKRRLSQRFPGYDFMFWGDPSGSHKRSEVDDQTAFGIFAQAGMQVRKADEAGRRGIRLETAKAVLARRNGLVISPTCVVVVTGMAGGYCFRRKKVSGAPTYEQEPDKDSIYSHPIDALLEIFMGGGESRVMLGRTERARPTSTLSRVNPFARTGSAWRRAG